MQVDSTLRYAFGHSPASRHVGLDGWPRHARAQTRLRGVSRRRRGNGEANQFEGATDRELGAGDSID